MTKKSTGRAYSNAWTVLIALAILLSFHPPEIRTVYGERAPSVDASSTFLRMHRRYRQPAHDKTLYDTLGVLPNATAAAITKAYRRKSREFHPDKRSDESDAEAQLDAVREAYDVLKDDATRLPYHRFGLIDSRAAADILAGGGVSSPELLRLMGYGPKYTREGQHHQRVMFLAATIVETIRPLVEGAVSQNQLAHRMAEECDRLKHLPLGAQILRCVGRAYRHSGQRFLRRHSTALSETKKYRITVDVSNALKDKFREAKNIATAAFATGKLILTEKTIKNSVKSLDPVHSDIDVEDLSHQLLTQEDIRDQDRINAQNAMIRTLQIEALWKISKVELDRTIQEACQLILSGDYFFFPSGTGADGWVGSTGNVIDPEVGRVRAAAALVLVGDIFVRCSKEGTSWRE